MEIKEVFEIFDIFRNWFYACHIILHTTLMENIPESFLPYSIDTLYEALTMVANSGLTQIKAWKAIVWLNELSTDIDFYLVRVEVYKIGNSDPAPKFTVIAGPTEIGKAVGSEKKKIAERHNSRLRFWESLLEKSKKKTSLHSNISPSMNSWISTSAGKSGLASSYVITFKHGQIELYIDKGKDSEYENKQIFDQFKSHQDEIEKELGDKFRWERLDDKRASRISKGFKNVGLNDEDKWDKLQNNMIDGMIRLEKAFRGYIQNIKN